VPYFARALAHRRPERVSEAISLGAGSTPLRISVPTKVAVAAVGRVHRHDRPGDPQRLPDRHLWLPLRAPDYAAPFPESVG